MSTIISSAQNALSRGFSSNQSEFCVTFPTFYSIESGGENSLTSGKERLSGG